MLSGFLREGELLAILVRILVLLVLVVAVVIIVVIVVIVVLLVFKVLHEVHLLPMHYLHFIVWPEKKKIYTKEETGIKYFIGRKLQIKEQRFQLVGGALWI